MSILQRYKNFFEYEFFESGRKKFFGGDEMLPSVIKRHHHIHRIVKADVICHDQRSALNFLLCLIAYIIVFRTKPQQSRQIRQRPRQIVPEIARLTLFRFLFRFVFHLKAFRVRLFFVLITRICSLNFPFPFFLRRNNRLS